MEAIDVRKMDFSGVRGRDELAENILTKTTVG